VDLALDPLPVRKSGSAGNQTRDLWDYSHELLPVDHRSGILQDLSHLKELIASFINVNKNSTKKWPTHYENINQYTSRMVSSGMLRRVALLRTDD
jgi:hypothetical protein